MLTSFRPLENPPTPADVVDAQVRDPEAAKVRAVERHRLELQDRLHRALDAGDADEVYRFVSELAALGDPATDTPDEG